MLVDSSTSPYRFKSRRGFFFFFFFLKRERRAPEKEPPPIVIELMTEVTKIKAYMGT